MKKTYLLMIVFCAISARNIHAQTIPCPEFANSISLLKGDNTLMELEQPEVDNKSKKKGLYRGIDNSVRMITAHSNVTASSKATFVYRPANPAANPKQQIRLYQFDAKSSFRELKVGGTTVFGGSKKVEDTSVPLTFEKVSDGCYKVKLGATLEPGEYGFTLAGGGNADTQGSTGGLGGAGGSGGIWFAFVVR